MFPVQFVPVRDLHQTGFKVGFGLPNVTPRLDFFGFYLLRSPEEGQGCQGLSSFAVGLISIDFLLKILAVCLVFCTVALMRKLGC